MPDQPSLATFERLVAERRYPQALQMGLQILNAIDDAGGRFDAVIADAALPGGNAEEIALVFATRFAATLGDLLTAPDWEFAPSGYELLLTYYRWIDLIFSLSGFRTSDHFLARIGKDAGGGRLAFEGGNFLRLLAMLSVHSTINFDFPALWRANPPAAVGAFLFYISSRYVFTRRAFEFREWLLQWLPERLAEVKLGSITLARAPEYYMHCSYAMTPHKHAIKRPLMEQMRRGCLEAGIAERLAPIPPSSAGRATIVVVGDRFSEGHATYRSHSRAIKALRPRFHVVGVVYPDPTGTPVADLFDEHVAIPAGELFATVRTLVEQITARQPALIFYIGVGMVAQVIALASLRLAPVQCASYGHTATTMSPAIDYFVLPEDFVGSAACFSEKVVAVPKEAMPFAPLRPAAVRRPSSDGTVRVAIAASTMKLNPPFFEALARIGERVESALEFQFFPLLAQGLAYLELARIVRDVLPRATVFPEVRHDTYFTRLAGCDLFLCPFPYGNMNSIIDAFQLGLPGICLDGTEAHAHADAALFSRIGLPAELAAQTADNYVAAAIRLIDDAAWRRRCGEIVAAADLDAAFFRGNGEHFCQAIEQLIWPA